MNGEKHRKKPAIRFRTGILDSIRQLWFPPEFRIAPPIPPLDAPDTAEAEQQAAPVIEAQEQSAWPEGSRKANRLIAELVTCLWYLKTKYFKRNWDEAELSGDDPRVRRALGRINRCISTLNKSGVEVHDPTGSRYPPGAEGMMRPIQFLPTDGLEFEVVSETVVPIIYRDERLVQRGEVFVAVPRGEATSTIVESAATSAPGAVGASDPCEASPLDSGPEVLPQHLGREPEANRVSPGTGKGGNVDERQNTAAAGNDSQGVAGRAQRGDLKAARPTTPTESCPKPGAAAESAEESCDPGKTSEAADRTDLHNNPS